MTPSPAGRSQPEQPTRHATPPDLHQARLRIAVLAGCLIYVTASKLLSDEVSWTAYWSFIGLMVVYGAFAVNMIRHFTRRPEPHHMRRTIAMFADHGAALSCLSLTGSEAAVLSWLHLFIVQGVGIRFGIGWMVRSQAIGLGCLVTLALANPFFREHGTLVAGMILSALVLPLYFAALVKREGAVREELEGARRVAEEEQRKALAASEAKSRFVAMVSHELRTPLTAIAAANELLLTHRLPVASHTVLTAQRDATTLMLGMVNDILDATKLEAGETQLDSTDFDLAALLGQITRGLGLQATRKNLALNLVIEASVPSHVRGSPFHVTRILQNLLGNALKFTQTGGVTVRATSVPRKSDTDSRWHWVKFEVSDSGVGISSEAQTRIFDRFSQADESITRKFGGTGLGLSIVREFATLMGGTVSVESTVGVGTTFTALLPFHPAQGSAEERSARVSAIWLGSMRSSAYPRLVQLCGESVPLHPAEDAVDAANQVRRILRHEHRVPVIFAAADRSLLDHAQEVREEIGMDVAWIGIGAHEYTPSEWARWPARAIWQKDIGEVASLSSALELATIVSDGDAETAESATDDASLRAIENRHRVLIAEDTPVIRVMLENILVPQGYEVVFANDGAEAVGRALSAKFDLIVLDYNMPELNGMEVIEKLAESNGVNRDTPIIIATAAPTVKIKNEAARVGASVLAKPFKIRDFLAVVKKTIARAQNVVRVAEEVADESEADAPAPNAHLAAPYFERIALVDHAALEATDEVFDGDSRIELAQLFVQDCRRSALLLERAIASRDIKLLRERCHAIIGYAPVFGAKRIMALIDVMPRTVEQLEQNLGVVELLVKTLRETAAEIETWAGSVSTARGPR